MMVFLFFIITAAACSAIEKKSFKDYAPPSQDSNHVETRASVTEEMVEDGESEKVKTMTVAEVDSITDGDTISIRNLDYSNIESEQVKEKIKNIVSANGGTLPVRFLAINTPEITKGQNEPYGEEAKALTEHLLSDGKIYVELDPLALFDKYDRLLGHLYNQEGINVQSALLQAGVARVAYVFDDYKYVSK